MALLAFDAPDRISDPFSIRATFAPARAKRRATAQPTTPPPITATSKLSCGGNSGIGGI
jgi:hypothetical protein